MDDGSVRGNTRTVHVLNGNAQPVRLCWGVDVGPGGSDRLRRCPGAQVFPLKRSFVKRPIALAVVLAHSGAGRPLAFMVALAGVWAMGLHMGWQMRQLQLDDPVSCRETFWANRDAGLIPVPFLAVAAWLG